MRQFFGKFRGKVVANVDPRHIGRVQVTVPAVLGDGTLSWALPCSPYAGDQVGFFAVPPVGANVWVEFEGGDPDHPIVGGCFWAEGECPGDLPEVKVWKTDGITVTLSDKQGDGGLTVAVASPAVNNPLKLAMTSSGIALSSSSFSVKITSSGVSVNDGALEVS